MTIMPTSDFSHLFNDLQPEERKRLAPALAEAQLLHIWQVKQAAIDAHNKFMRELDDWMKNIKHELDKTP